MGLFHLAELFGMTIRESANDGSDFTNPSADYRRLFLGEDGQLHVKDSAGTVTDIGAGSGAVATDSIWDAAGDLVQGTGANTAAKLTLGASGTVVRSNGTNNAYAFPPGHEIDYAQFTSNVSPNATTEGTANTVVTGNSVTYENVPYLVHVHANNTRADTTSGRTMTLWLYVDGSSVGPITVFSSAGAASTPLEAFIRYTPSAGAHTLSIRASVSAGTGLIVAGAGGAGVAASPGFIRVTKC